MHQHPFRSDCIKSRRDGLARYLAVSQAYTALVGDFQIFGKMFRDGERSAFAMAARGADAGYFAQKPSLAKQIWRFSPHLPYRRGADHDTIRPRSRPWRARLSAPKIFQPRLGWVPRPAFCAEFSGRFWHQHAEARLGLFRLLSRALGLKC